jgi:DNA-binding XRE family transcriptional regulator
MQFIFSMFRTMPHMQKEVKIKMPQMPFAKCDNLSMGHRIVVPTELPERLRVLREEVYDWTKTEAARRCKISPSLYGRYEAGKVEPTLSNILKMREGFRVDFETLIGEKNLNILPSEKKRGNSA